MCSHKLKIENILNKIFILLPRSCPRVGLRGAGGVKNFSVGIAMAPHRLRTLVLLCVLVAVCVSCLNNFFVVPLVGLWPVILHVILTCSFCSDLINWISSSFLVLS